MTDIVVTTPKRYMREAAQEAEYCKACNGGWYFRALHSIPQIQQGEKVWYVEDGYIRGFCFFDHMDVGNGALVCDTTGKRWPGSCHIHMRAEDWHWIKPIPMRGFQGWRYYQPTGAECVVGGWRDSRPETPGNQLTFINGKAPNPSGQARA